MAHLKHKKIGPRGSAGDLKIRVPEPERLKAQHGIMLPIAKDSKQKLRSVTCKAAKSGMGAWHVLENRTRVYVLYKSNRPIMWVPYKEDEKPNDSMQELMNMVERIEIDESKIEDGAADKPGTDQT